MVVVMPDEFAFELHGFDVTIVDFGDYAWIAVVGEAAEFVGQVNGFHRFGLTSRGTPSACYKFRTTSATEPRTRRVLSGWLVSEYTRSRFSVPEARTITQPASPR